MKFYIKRIGSETKFKDGLPIYSTGNDSFASEKAERFARDIDGENVKYVTGFTEEDIERSPLLKTEEKEIHLKQLKKNKDRLKKAYNETALDASNNNFWGKTDRRVVKLDEKLFNLVFDDENVEDLILKQGILCNAFPQIAYREEDKYKLPGKKYYMVEVQELEQKNYEKEYGSKLDAFAKLHEIKNKKGKDLMLYLTYFLTDGTDKGFSRKSSLTAIETSLIDYIEGKNVKKDKKQCASNFIKACLEYEQNKDEFMAIVTYRIAKHFNLIYNLKGKIYIRSNKMELGTDEKSSVKILTLPTNSDEFLNLHNEAESKLG